MDDKDNIQQKGKKSKKDKRKKKDDDDEDLDAMLAELALEIEGGGGGAASVKKTETTKSSAQENHETQPTNDTTVTTNDEKEIGGDKKGKKNKNQQKQQSQDKPQPPTANQTNAKKTEKTTKLETFAGDEVNHESVTATSTDVAKDAGDQDGGTGVGDDDDDDNGAADNDEEGGGGGKKNKNRRKTRKEREKEKKEKEAAAKTKSSGPGKKQLALMQEVLRKQKEEEERLQREEEERIRREEEAEQARLEQLRIEQEKKEKRKQKEKERKERLKKEGKLLTAKQKADIQRAKLSLQIAQEQGQIVVGAVAAKSSSTDNGDATTATKTKLSERQRRKQQQLAKKQQQQQQKQENDQSSKDESTEPIDGDDDDIADLPDDEMEPEEEEEDILDDWEKMVVEKSNKKASSNKKATTPTTLKTSVSTDLSQHQQSPTKGRTASCSSSVPATPSTPNHVSSSFVDASAPLPPANTSAAACARPPDGFRSPIICVLGHVDTGKTKLLDYIRKTHVQDNEAGGITQQIGATFVPPIAIYEQCKAVKNKAELNMPGLLIIDTPGHESFTNLRSRGSSLCDIAILVIDIMHGLEKQTLESIQLLKQRKTPFVVALNKIDRLYEWRSNLRKDIQELVAGQAPNTKLEFQKRANEVIVQLAEQSINAALFYENNDPRSYVSLVPTSAHTGDGMGNLINLIVKLTQTMLAKRIQYVADTLDATVLEVKAIPGLGTTIDVILVNGRLREGDKIVLAGHDGPIVTHIRSLLVPQPLKELRVKSPYEELKVIYGSMGVKIAAHDLEKAVAGLQLYIATNDAEIDRLKQLCWSQFSHAMRAIKCSPEGVYVQASTLGSLEALLEFLKESKIPYSGVRIGPVVKKDVMRASTMLEHSPDHAVILAFDVKIERDAQELADQLGVKIFAAEIIYHLFDRFTEYKANLKAQRKEQNRHLAVFPCKLRILPNCIFNKRDPIVIGVTVEDGVLMPGTPIAVPDKELDMIGRVSTIEHDHKALESARKGAEVCIKIEHCSSDAPKMFGRHFDQQDILYSRITRESIDILKEHFRDEVEKSDWKLIMELKKIFQVI